MSVVTPAAAYWTAVLAETTDLDRAEAVKAILTTGTKLKFYDNSDTLIRTVTTDAWTRSALSGGYYPLVPGTYTGSQTGTGTPSYVVITTSADVEIVRMSAGVNSGIYQIPSAFATDVDLTPGAFKLKYPSSDVALSGKKWYPGHYLYTSQDWLHDVSTAPSRRAKVVTNPYFTGYKLLGWWDQMETSAGVYNFSEVLTELDAAEVDGKKVWLQIEERSFHGMARGLPCPQYVYDGGGTYAYVGNGENILAPKFWVPWVGEAYLSMLAALMEEIDSHPALAMVSTEECSIEGSWLQAGYTWQAMNAFILEYARVGSAGAVESLWHQNMGWSNESSDNFTEHYRMTDTVVRSYKAGLSPSDLRLSGPTRTLNTIYGRYIYDRYAGETFFAPSVEWHTFYLPETPKQLLDHAVDDLGTQFIGWAEGPVSGGTFTTEDCIAEVTRQQGRINTARPSNVPLVS